MTAQRDGRSGKLRLLLTTLLALLSALLLLLAVVLPAEFSIDPLGTGKALGVLGLADGGVPAVTPQPRAHRAERAAFTLAPYESVEYSYRMDAGQSMVFSWRATGELVYNLHSSPAGGPAGYAESFASGRSATHNGTYVAPFPGRHGWFFENRGNSQVELTLVTAGFFRAALRAAAGSQRESEPSAVLDE